MAVLAAQSGSKASLRGPRRPGILFGSDECEGRRPWGKEQCELGTL